MKAIAYEFTHTNGHAIVDYSEQTYVGPLTADKGYTAHALVYAVPRTKEEAKAMVIAGMRALGMDLD